MARTTVRIRRSTRAAFSAECKRLGLKQGDTLILAIDNWLAANETEGPKEMFSAHVNIDANAHFVARIYNEAGRRGWPVALLVDTATLAWTTSEDGT